MAPVDPADGGAVASVFPRRGAVHSGARVLTGNNHQRHHRVSRGNHPHRAADQRSPDMIEITNVSKAYGTTNVLHDVSLTIPANGITSLIGPNVAGKSTLLSLIGRLLP